MAAETRAPLRPLSVVGWWLVTLLILVVLDDLTLGPAFWTLSRMASPVIAVIAIYAVYVPVQVAIVTGATQEDPGRFAAFFLTRLRLDRRNVHVAENERRLRSRVLGAVSAVLMSLVIGGVLPPVLLWQRGADRTSVLRLSVATATVYASEFALLHGFLPSLV